MLRAVAVAVLTVCSLLLGTATAFAHSELERSDPANGGMVPVGRTSLTLWFTEQVNLGASTFTLRTTDGRPVSITLPSNGEAGASVVRLGTAPLSKSEYVLEYRTLSLDDGHTSGGSVLFGVGVRPTEVARQDAGLPELPGLLVRWVDLAGLLLVIGALAVSGRVLASAAAEAALARQRALRIAGAAAVIAVVSGAVTPLTRAPRGGSSTTGWLDSVWSTLSGTPWGHVWLAREVALGVAAAAIVPLALGREQSRRRWLVIVVGLAAVLGLEAWAGHAADLPTRSLVTAAASAAHLAAAGVWVGGLVVLAVCLLPTMRRDTDARGPLLATVWRAYSPVAATATGALVATGLYESGRYLPDLHSVTSTLYGGALGSKALLVTIALTTAALNTLLVNPRLAAPVGRLLRRPPGWSPVSLARFPRIVLAEVVVLIMAVAAAGVLTSVPTARETAAAAAPARVHSANVDGLFVTFEELPAGPDRSRLLVRLTSTVKPEPAPVTGVVVTLNGPSGFVDRVVLDLVEPGRYEAETRRPATGRWLASVAVQREGLADAVTQAPWTVAASGAEVIRPLEVVTTAFALLLLLITTAVIAVAATRRRRVPPEEPARLVAERAGELR